MITNSLYIGCLLLQKRDKTLILSENYNEDDNYCRTIHVLSDSEIKLLKEWL